MVSFKASKNSDRQSLLGPRRNGIFGKKSGRSEDPVSASTQSNRTSAGGAGLFRSPMKHQAMTDSMVDEVSAFQSPTPPVSPESSAPSDDQSHMSDLTDHDYGQHVSTSTTNNHKNGPAQVSVSNKYNNKNSSIANSSVNIDPPGKLTHTRSNESPVHVMKELMVSRKAMDPEPSPAKAPPASPPSLVQNLFSLVDKACVTPSAITQGKEGESSPAKTPATYPEWGRAPTKDDGEEEADFKIHKPAQWNNYPSKEEKARSGIVVRSRQTDSASETSKDKPATPDTVASTPSPASKASPERKVSEVHVTPPETPSPPKTAPVKPSRPKREKFEMVLKPKDDEQDVKKQPKKVRNPFAMFKKEGSNSSGSKRESRNSGNKSKESQGSNPSPRYDVGEEKKEEISELYESPVLQSRDRTPQLVSNHRGFQPSTKHRSAHRISTGGSSSKAAAQKEARYKHLLGTWMNAKTPLETVQESDEGSLVNNEATEMTVRVPGVRSPDAFLSDKDLVGDECNISILAEDKRVIAPTEPQDETPNSLVDQAAAAAASLLPFGMKSGPVQEASDDKATNSTWMEKLMGENAPTEQNTPQEESKSGQFEKPSHASRSVNPVWKAAVCATSGRTYYYHRLTRVTTWTKPKDEDIIQPKQRREEGEIKKVQIPESTGPSDEFVASANRNGSNDSFEDTKQKISEILKAMSPPNGESVERLMAQYEGREKELLAELEDMTESRPFDEPPEMSPANDPTSPEEVENLSTPMAMNGRVHTHTSHVSGFSSALMSETTQQIKNTARGKARCLETQSHATSISSRQGDMLPPVRTPPRGRRSPSRVPSNIPVPRARELNVEDYSSERSKYRLLDKKGVVRANQGVNQSAATPTKAQPFDAAYFGDNDTTDEKDTDTCSLPNDSISALSETDVSFMERKEALDFASRRALDDAIAREDWDLAAALSEGMRTRKASPSFRKEITGEWTQTELDRFISENDWDAVANYIAKVRNNAKSGSKSRRRSSPRRDTGIHGSRARSMRSDESSESGSFSSYRSDSTTSSSYSDEEPVYRARRKGNNFAC